jgi:AcrR family transcriptional regulator
MNAQISGSLAGVKIAKVKRRLPQQRRARQTVEAVLDAVLRLIKRHGIDAVTTNRVAEVAGVSIGSVYQYFPDKRALFVALHERHSEAMGRVVESTLVTHAASSLDELIGALIAAMVEAHAAAPELYAALAEVPHGAAGARDLAERLRGALRLAITARARQRDVPRDLDRVLFVVPQMIDALCHAAVLRRPPRLSLAAATEEITRAVLAYLHA